MKKKVPIVYLIHLEEPFHNRQHYTGYTKNFQQRMHAHRNTRNGSLFLRQANAYKIKWKVVRVWVNSNKKKEKEVKRNAKYYCPTCSPKS